MFTRMKVLIVVLLFLFSSECIATDYSLTEAMKLHPAERIENFKKILQNAKLNSDKDNIIHDETINYLIIDAEYELMKQKEATQLFELAKQRLEGIPQKITFIRYNAVYDALSIADAIRGAWLPAEKRKEYLEWRYSTENELSRLIEQNEEQPEAISTKVEQTTNEVDHFKSINILVDNALKKAVKENLNLIKNAEPNKYIENLLGDCEQARSRLIKADQEIINSDQLNWDKALNRLNKVVSTLKIRQLLKYNLWAENVYRSCSSKKTSTNNEAESEYIRLAMIDLSLLQEQSLAREISQKMYELYDKLKSVEAKTKVRYQAIMQLGKRRSLDEF